MIVCKNLTKAFSEQVVLSGFSYTFGEHGFYLLYGESGSGKTTFLNILSGFLDFEGEIQWGDRTFTGRVLHSDIESEFDYITQDAFFADFLSVSDNLRLICGEDAEIAAMLDRFGLADKMDQMPTTLSGGEKQRLAIARALLGGKKVLFFDEPTASLDEENKTAIFELLAKLKGSVLIICSSHDALARAYADEVIPFTKVKERTKAPSGSAAASAAAKAAVKSEPERRAEKRKSAYKKAGLNRFLMKYFRSGQRSRKATVLFTLFLVLAACLCLLADTPMHKLEACIANLYKINYLEVSTRNKTRWSDIAPGDEGIRAVQLYYSAPDGNDDLPNDVIMRPTPEYELSLNMLPFDEDLFMLSGKIRYGSYFTDRDQVILSSEMAASIYPSDPGKLIGEHIRKNIYGRGDVDFEIVGIFDAFDDFDKLYLRQLGTHIAAGDDYDSRDYERLYFVNSKITDDLEDDESFFNGHQRCYYLFFDSYRDMKTYYDRYAEGLNALDNVSVSYNDSVDISMVFAFETMAYTLLPIAAFMVIFATLFAVALKKTEFVYNNRFISVFEYSGYEKKRVIGRFIGLHMLDLAKTLLIAEAAAFLLTAVVNLLNRRFIWLPYQIFTYNISLILLFNVIVLAVSAAAFHLLLGRVKVSSWYENLIAGRDLI